MKQNAIISLIALSFLSAVVAHASDGTTIEQTPFVEPIVGPFQANLKCDGDAVGKATSKESSSTADSASACRGALSDLVIITATSDEQGKPLPDFSIPKFDHKSLVRIAICNVGKDKANAPIEVHWDRTGGTANDNPGPGGAKTLEPGYCWGPSTVEEYRDIMVRVKEPSKSTTVEWAFYPQLRPE